MRESVGNPPTVGARGRIGCSDARLCEKDCFVKKTSNSSVQRRSINSGVSSRNVQGHTCGNGSAARESRDSCYLLGDTGGRGRGNERRRKPCEDSAAQEDVNTHYLLRALPTAGEINRKGKFKKRGKKAHSNKAAAVNALSVEEAIRMLEEDLSRLGTSAPKSKPREPARRSARLARSQRRTGQWRNKVRQREEAEEASRSVKQAGSSREHRSRGGASNGNPQGSSAAEHVMDKMREKLKPDGNDILDSILGNPP